MRSNLCCRVIVLLYIVYIGLLYIWFPVGVAVGNTGIDAFFSLTEVSNTEAILEYY